MDCERAREIIAFHPEGDFQERPGSTGDAADDLDEVAAAAVRRHLDECAECRRLADETRRAVDLAREALSHFEPGEGFEERVAAELRREPVAAPARAPRRRRIVPRIVWLAAAAAAVVAVALTIRTGGGGARLLEGRLAEGVTKIAPGVTYTASERSAVEIAGGARALLGEGSRFSVDDSKLHLACGECYLVNLALTGEATRLAARGIEATVGSGSEVYLHAPLDEGPSGGLAALILDTLCRPVHAAGPREPGALLVVFKGEAEVTAGQMRWTVRTGEALFADRAADRAKDGPFASVEFLRETERKLAAAERRSAELAVPIARYREVVAGYLDDLAAKRKLRDSLGAGSHERAEMAARIALVEGLKEAHEGRLAKMVAETAEGRATELRDLELRSSLVRDAERGHGEAVDRLTGF